MLVFCTATARKYIVLAIYMTVYIPSIFCIVHLVCCKMASAEVDQDWKKEHWRTGTGIRDGRIQVKRGVDKQKLEVEKCMRDHSLQVSLTISPKYLIA